jgi:predicted small integral membrane protein
VHGTYVLKCGVKPSELANLAISCSALFLLGFLLVALVNIVLALANLARPYWTPRRATFRLLNDMAGAIIFCWLLKANILAEIAGANIPPLKVVQLTGAINFWLARMFPVAVIFVIVIALVNGLRIVRVAAPNAHIPGETRRDGLSVAAR